MSAISKESWLNRTTSAVALVGAVVGLSTGALGAYVGTQVSNAHRDWIDQDHEKRLAVLEKTITIVYDVRDSVARIEGALGVKKKGSE